MIDDIIDTAGTITLGPAPRGRGKGGLCLLYPFCLVGAAFERLQEAPIKEIVVTNTIPHHDKIPDKMKVISAALIGRRHYSHS